MVQDVDIFRLKSKVIMGYTTYISCVCLYCNVNKKKKKSRGKNKKKKQRKRGGNEPEDGEEKKNRGNRL